VQNGTRVVKQRRETRYDALFPEWRKRVRNLLELAREAHGKLRRWSQLKAVTADLSVTGALWQLKGQAGALQQIRIEAELHRQKLTTHFRGQDKRTTFAPDSVTLQTEGRTEAARQITNESWSSVQKGQRKLTRPLSGVNGEVCEKVCKRKRKKVLTESALLEMDGYSCAWSSDSR
jgi:hypothetical protein